MPRSSNVYPAAMSDRPPMIAQSRSDLPATGTGARDVLGHPRGLAVLFATESWERFSYFGNAALVVLYMVKYLLEPGRVETVLGFGAVKAALEFLFGRLDPQPLASPPPGWPRPCTCMAVPGWWKPASLTFTPATPCRPGNAAWPSGCLIATRSGP